MTKINRLAVFCGASQGIKPMYVEAIKQLATLLAKSNIGLVYGGARVGLMGHMADAMLELGGEVIGVMPSFLTEKELAHDEITELHVVDSMHERKERIFELADAFVMAPGGHGTLDEFFEMTTWSQLGLHKKPSGILNTGNYFDHLLKFFNHMVDEEFLIPMYNNMLIVENSPERLIHEFLHYQEPIQFKRKQDILACA